MKKFSIKLTSLILSIAIILVTVPLTVFATTSDKGEEIDTASYDTESLGNTVSDIYELTDRREEYTKHFRLEDGSVIAAQYDDPVHYLDENNNWQDIDNTLSDIGSEYSTSNAKIKFAKKVTGNESLFTLHDGNAKITMSLDGAIKKTEGIVINHSDAESEMTKLQKMMSLEKISANIVYADILNGVDLEYIVQSDYVKENIIVKERQSSYSYTFTLKLNNLDAALNADGSISIVEPGTENIVYSIPAPVVYDDNYNHAPSEAAYYKLTQAETKKYTLTVTVDSDWMNAEDRAYPVTVDPTVYKGGRNLLQMRDTYVSSANPTTAYGSQKVLRAGYDSTYGYTRAYVLLKSLPTLPKGSYITSAQINLQISSALELYDITLAAYPIELSTTSMWSESGMTWNTHPSQFSQLLDYVNIEFLTEIYDWSWDITEAAKKWYNGTLTNHGICIGLLEETITSTNYVTFHSSESNVPTSGRYLPFYSFTYRDAKGLEDYYSYLSSSAGVAGSGYVNHATGNMVLTKPLISTTDSLMPYTVALTYNSALPKLPYQYSNNIMTAYTTGYSPYGFKLNFQETLIKKSYIDWSHTTAYHYIWADADGTEHYFLPVGGKTNTYQDDDGLKLTLDTSSTTQLTITDLDHTVRKFSKMSSAPSGISEAWYLTSITDKNGNTLSFTFDSSYRPTVIKMTPNGSSTPIEHLLISYASNGMPYLIWNPSSKEAVVLRYASTYYVSQIDHAHGNDNVTAQNWLDFYNNASVKTNITVDASAKYTYSSGYIVSALDTLSGYKIVYSYSGGKVSAVQEYGGSSVGQKLTLTYYPGYTEIRASGSDDVHGNDDDIITVYAFDEALRCISSYSTDINGYMIYGATNGEYVSDNEKAKNSIKTSSVISDIATNYLLNSNFEMNGISSLAYWNTTGTVSATALKYISYGSPESYNRNLYDSSYNVKLTVSSGTTSTIYQNVALGTGKYTLSADVLNEVDKGVTIRLKAQSLDDNSVVYTKDFDFYKGVYSPVGAEESLTFEIVGTSTWEERFKVSLEVIGDSGIGSTDILLSHMTLSKAVGYSMNSKVNYGSFEMSTISNGSSRYALGNFWKTSNPDFSLITTTQSELSGNSLYIQGGGINAERTVYQTVYQASSDEKACFISNPDDYAIYPKKYRVSGRALSTNALHSYFSSFEISVRVEYVAYINENFVTYRQMYSFPFNDYCASWQFVSGMFTTTPNYFVDSITIYLKFDGQTGSAYFDDVSLCFLGTDTSPSAYDYDPDTGLLTEELSMYSRICYVYDEEDKTKLVRKIDKYSVTDYSYDDNHRISRVKYYSFTGDWEEENCGYVEGSTQKTLRSTTTYEYNAYGQQVKETVSSGSGSLVSTKTYKTDNMSSKIFGALLSETDALGRTNRYFYDENKGYLLASTGPDGNGAAYTYDGMGRMTSVYPAQVYSAAAAGYAVNDGAENVTYTYNSAGRLGSIITDTTTYNFTYDAFGNSSSVAIGGQQLASYTYNSNNGKISSMTYGNGVSVKYDYDELDRTVKIWYKGSGASNYTVAYEYEYDASGNLCTFYDRISDQITTYRYDSAGRLCEYYITAEDSDFQTKLLNGYDSNGRLQNHIYSYKYVRNGTTHTLTSSGGIGFRYDGAVSTVSTYIAGYNFYTSYAYDVLGRQTQNTTSLGHILDGSGVSSTYEYTYSAGANGGTTSLQISAVNTTVGSSTENYSYTYDVNGRITHIYINGTLKYSYEYDDLGQLVRENNTTWNRTFIYTYDNAGNILSKKEYQYTTAATVSGNATTYNYTYGNSSWWDLLTSYRGQTITYDNIGNPLSYYNGNSYTFTWAQGRRLATAIKGSNTLSFEYNDEGIRTSKTVNGITHHYQLAGSRILSENWIDSSGVYHVVVFIYDENGSPIGMSYSNSTYEEGTADNYLFVKNMQGDVIAVYNTNGTKLVSYSYDAWGNITTTYHNGGGSTAAQYNPFKYRGYYHDSETGFYYLNSRYYDPAIGRFLNADSRLNTSLGILGSNMYAYCLSNPTNKVDFDGNKPGDLFDTMDEAARDAAIYLGSLSFENGWEYITVIYSVNKIERTYKTVKQKYTFLWWSWTKTRMITIETKTKKYTYTAAKTNKDPWTVRIPLAPLFKKRLATVHTHPMGSGRGITKFSPGDKDTADRLGMIDYVYGPNGELRKYDPSTGADIPVFSDLPVSQKTPWEN